MHVDWEKIKSLLPKTAWPLLDDLSAADKPGSADESRSIDMVLRQKIAGLQGRFDGIKKEAQK